MSTLRSRGYDKLLCDIRGALLTQFRGVDAKGDDVNHGVVILNAGKGPLVLNGVEEIKMPFSDAMMNIWVSDTGI